MSFLDSILSKRRSIRKYLDKSVEQRDLKKILEAARIAPSACNAQPWRFISVIEKNLKKEVINKGLGGIVVPNTWTKTAPAIIVVCSDLSLLTHTLAEKVQGIQYHLIDIGIACEHLVLKAEELGLGTCYIGWFNGKGIKKVLDLPLSWNVECLITLGYPDESPDAKPRKPLEEIAFLDKMIPFK